MNVPLKSLSTEEISTKIRDRILAQQGECGTVCCPENKIEDQPKENLLDVKPEEKTETTKPMEKTETSRPVEKVETKPEFTEEKTPHVHDTSCEKLKCEGTTEPRIGEKKEEMIKTL